MATPQLSPGVLIREVDLTVGRADNVLDNIGAIAGPFPLGPVEEPIDITTEQDLINVFGKPLSTDSQYEYWMSASSYLTYGGILKVVRADGSNLANANVLTVGTGSTAGLKIKNFDSYELNLSDKDTVNWLFASKNPGSWANGVKVAIIDDKADQTISGISTGTFTFTVGVTTTGTYTANPLEVGVSTTAGIQLGDEVRGNEVSVGTTVVGISTGLITLSQASTGTNGFVESLEFGDTVASGNVQVGFAVTAPLSNITTVGAGSTSSFSGYLKAIVTGVGEDSVDVKIISRVSSTGTETTVDYAEGVPGNSFQAGNSISYVNNSGASVATTSIPASGVVDWYEQQKISLTNGGDIFWKSLAPKPGTTQYAADRNGKSDEIHIVAFDDLGTITGIKGNLLEKHIGLSKATDAVSASNSPTKIFWKNYVGQLSPNLYVGDNPSDAGNSAVVYQTGFSSGFTLNTNAQGLWNLEAQDRVFSAIGNQLYTLGGGVDYSTSGGMKADLSKIISAYDLFSNKDEVAVDFILQGPSGGDDIYESQAKAAKLISIANQRRDCIAVISPHRQGVVDQTNTEAQTNNIIEFFSGVNSSLPSSSYAVFDSGYKYTYDRFNNKFRYLPCNPDIAGLMVRTSINAYPWFSPAGQQRGILNNAVKLAYNPSRAQRDRLYPQRVNAIINQPGVGILLFGDKTALGYASAFDRINVRRLFLTVEQALERSANAQLFELNDELTRANFVNIVEPYLRDVQAKRGVYDFLVVCDATNNTPDVIDNSEFRADIYLKPTKSINYVTLTFVATRTGVSFEEVAGRV
jgi:hypothetical protein